MNFDESLKYLYGLGNEVLAMKLGLETIRILLAALGNPQNNYLKVQIAGTNGKGSTCAFLESICVSAGIKTGSTTSPHLVSITERIKINGREISETDFARHATLVRETSEKLVESGKLETVPTFFEQVTAIALNAFAEAKIELAILETGLGGRFDATTAANAEIAAITPIDFDHQKILGDTLAEIASEKAAIIRADTKVVVSRQKPEAEKVIQKVCENFDVKPQNTDFKSEITGIDERKRFVVNFETAKSKYENVHINLLGRHQIENSKTAILLAEILREKFKIKPENIVEGLQTASHKGRLEFRGGILFDGAHNIAGAKALREFLDEFVNQPVTMIFGAMRDKNIEEIGAILFPKIENLILTKIDNERSLSEADWRKFAALENVKGKVLYASNARDAYKMARKLSAKRGLICVTGSLYLIGEAQKVLF